MNHSAVLDEINQIFLANLPTLRSGRYKGEYKVDDSPVTEADVWLENLIGSHLGKRMPGLRVIGEESSISNGKPTTVIWPSLIRSTARRIFALA